MQKIFIKKLSITLLVLTIFTSFAYASNNFNCIGFADIDKIPGSITGVNLSAKTVATGLDESDVDLIAVDGVLNVEGQVITVISEVDDNTTILDGSKNYYGTKGELLWLSTYHSVHDNLDNIERDEEDAYYYID